MSVADNSASNHQLLEGQNGNTRKIMGVALEEVWGSGITYFCRKIKDNLTAITFITQTECY